ncbi:ABC transporter substrate-binding protein [Streptomyces sp. NPDC001508]|uniref:ABC transporter substrate-binding protein n=1 Tax=Streptomyces sp. NPDC001508 TaxID=3154656 RepID=UPI0033247E46
MKTSYKASVAATLVGACVLTGCVGKNNSAAQQTQLQAVTTSVPAATKNVDTVNWNLGTGEPSTLDPALSATEEVSTVVGNMCESLFTFGKDSQLQPALAEKIDHPDSLTYVIHLRNGVTFWDGKPVTAEDVLYSINRVLDPKTGSSWITWAPNLDTIKITGGKEITIKLKKADALASDYFATPAFAVVEKAFAEAAGKDFGTAKGGVMCTGPYKLTRWSQGRNIVLTRNDAWWNTSVEPKVKTLRFKFISSSSAQAAALASGDIDGEYAVPRAAQHQLASKGTMLYGKSLSPTFLSVLNSKGALSDPATRQALQNLIDYQGIVRSVYGGTAQALRALVPPAAWGYGKDVYKTAYDKLPAPAQNLKKAKSLVSGSVKAKQKIVLAYTSASEEETKIATAIADAATQVGMKIELKPLTAEQYSGIFSSAEARAGLDIFLVTGYLEFAEPVTYYAFFTTGNFYNFVGYKNEGYDAAIKAARSTEDDTQRAQLVSKAQAIMAKDLINVPIVTQYVNVYYRKGLGGLVPRQSYYYTPWATSLGGV